MPFTRISHQRQLSRRTWFSYTHPSSWAAGQLDDASLKLISSDVISEENGRAVIQIHAYWDPAASPQIVRRSYLQDALYSSLVYKPYFVDALRPNSVWSKGTRYCFLWHFCNTAVCKDLATRWCRTKRSSLADFCTKADEIVCYFSGTVMIDQWEARRLQPPFGSMIIDFGCTSGPVVDLESPLEPCPAKKVNPVFHRELMFKPKVVCACRWRM